MVSNKPSQITLNFIDHINNGEKRLANFLGYKLCIDNKVFPVDSPFSYSSKITAKKIPKNVDSVLDIGTGTGVQAIIATMRGAKKVLAVDIDDNSLRNAEENVEFHNLGHIIEIRKSDLFDKLKPGEKFDLIISQLPFADVKYSSGVSHFLFDPDFKLHERLLKNAKRHLSEKGFIMVPSGDVANEKRLNELIKEYNYKISKIEVEKYKGLLWKIYFIRV